MGRVVEAAAERPMTPTETIVARAWAAELRVPQVGLDEDFIDLGSHSLQGLAIVARLEQTFGIPIPVRTLFEEPTVADLAAWIDHRREVSQPASAEIVRLQGAEGSALFPIFAIPGGRGDGRQLYGLAKLAREIDPNRPVYGFPGDPPVPDSVPHGEWVAAAAAAVIAAMRAVQPHGPYHLLGVCAGGLIAWEMACQLETLGETVHLLLIDTRNPQPRVGETTFRQVVTESMSNEERRARRRQRRERRRAPTQPPPGTMPETTEGEGTRRVVMTRAYHPGPLRGPVTVLVNQEWHRVSATLGWATLVDDLNVVVIGKGHGLDWHIPEVADRAREWLDRIAAEDFGSGQHLPSGRESQTGVHEERKRGNALAEPSTVDEAAASLAIPTPRAPALAAAPPALTMRISDIWSDVLGFGPIAADADLFDLGADSLQAARIVAGLQQAVGIEIPLDVLIEDRTPARLAAWIAATGSTSEAPGATFSPPASAKRPLFFVSSANISNRNALRPTRLGRAIDPERPVYDLVVPPRLRVLSPHDPEEAARTAKVCVDAARAAQPHGPYLVIGLHEGGPTACEMARQWERAEEVVHLLLVDAWSPEARTVDGERRERQSRRRRAPSIDGARGLPEAFGGPVTLIANRTALAENATLGWGDDFGPRLSIVPFGPRERSRRLQIELAELIRGWLEEVKQG